jgi:FkbM family methyltransferase
MDFNILIKNKLNIESILDVGSHAGTFTIECKNYYPDAYYYMIEGNPISEAYISNLGIDYKIVYLSDIVKDTIVYKTKYNSFNTGDSLYRENTDFYSDDLLITEKIKTSTLYEIFKDEVTFDLIKIDSQGSEMDIIKGGLDMCKKAKIFYLEASVYPYNSGAPMFDELKEFMSSIGYPYYKIVSDIYHPNDNSLIIQHDVLFSKIILI